MIDQIISAGWDLIINEENKMTIQDNFWYSLAFFTFNSFDLRAIWGLKDGQVRLWLEKKQKRNGPNEQLDDGGHTNILH